jgi:uncharacterized repeat protein (TIGR01451 family)
MGRRLVCTIGMALAVGCGVRLVGADDAPPLPAAVPPGAAEAQPPGEFPPLKEPPPPAAPAAEMPPPAEPAAVSPPHDAQVEPAQAPYRAGAGAVAKGAVPSPDRGPLPAASEMPGRPAPASGSAREADPFVLPADQLPPGRQTVALSVEVVGPATLNINQPTTLKIVVKNTGTADARGVVVRDELPEGLEFLSSQPVEQRSESLLFWNLNVVAAGSEQVIALRVKPKKTGAFDHAATVTMRAGSRARTIVREPKLKVEQVATSGKVLKGQPVEFKITVSNPGDGPARNVKVLAKLSAGLREGSGEPNPENLFDQTIAVLNPGERVELEPLVADTILGDLQSCLVKASSGDVEPGSPEAECLKEITVVEPKLKLAVAGPEERYTDTIASYMITLENPGTATARNVKVLATVPNGKPVVPVPAGARYDAAKRQLVWSVAQVEPGDKEKVTLPFQVKMGGPGRYQISAEARADGGLLDTKIASTSVVGLADVEIDVTERRRSVDVGQETTFQIRIKNFGSKDATQLLLNAKLSKNLEATATDPGSQDLKEARFNPDTGELVFPPIPRLGPGKELVLGIKVRAREPLGLATCRVFLAHDDLGDARLDDVAWTKVTPHN